MSVHQQGRLLFPLFNIAAFALIPSRDLQPVRPSHLAKVWVEAATSGHRLYGLRGIETVCGLGLIWFWLQYFVVLPFAI
jgi:hypothetical protein